jgi:hypothetical protein
MRESARVRWSSRVESSKGRTIEYGVSFRRV